MAGGSWTERCPKCNTEDSLEVSDESRDRSLSEAYCLNCGYYDKVVTGRLSLYELNIERRESELSELNELPYVKM